MRPRISIRQRLLLLLLVPTLALLAFAGAQLRESLQLSADARTLQGLVQVSERQLQVLHALQIERTRTLEALHLGADGGADMTGDDLTAARQQTDASLQALVGEVDTDVLAAAGSGFLTAYETTVTEARALVTFRTEFDTGGVTVDGVGRAFEPAVEAALAFDEALAHVVEDPAIDPRLLASSAFARLKSAALERGDATLLGVAGAVDRSTTVRRVTRLANEQALWLDVLDRALEDGEQGPIIELAAIDPDSEVNRVLSGLTGGSLGTIEEIAEENRGTAQRLRTVEIDLADRLVRAAADVEEAASRRTYVLGGLTLVALLSLVLTALVLTRSVIRPLRHLTSLAARQGLGLKAKVEQVTSGGELPRSEFENPRAVRLLDRDDELGELAAALRASSDEVSVIALQQARTREAFARTISDVARREQGLVERQLTLLDGLEDREEDPDELAELFRLDHLATRMRRNAENLLLLASGQLPGAAGEEPAPLVDVVRTAAAEIEDYARVDVRVGIGSRVAGHAATPVSHLLAELIENATRFSPPDTRVDVTAREHPDGVTVSVIDRGIGMLPDELEATRARLLEPPLLEAAESRRLGLYVVGLIAQRLGIAVDITSAEAGGLRVDVHLPGTMILGPDDGPAWADLRRDPNGQAQAQRWPSRPATFALGDSSDAMMAVQQLLDGPSAAPSTHADGPALPVRDAGELPVRDGDAPPALPVRDQTDQADDLPVRDQTDPAPDLLARDQPVETTADLPVRGETAAPAPPGGPSDDESVAPAPPLLGDALAAEVDVEAGAAQPMPVLDPLPDLPVPSDLPVRGRDDAPPPEEGSGISLAKASAGATTNLRISDLGALLAGINDDGGDRMSDWDGPGRDGEDQRP